MHAEEIRHRLRFDVQRLRVAAHRLQAVDETLKALKRRLEIRAANLSSSAKRDAEPEIGGDGLVHLRFAQAQATAQLAKKATLSEVLRHSSRIALIASMAVNRWLGALGDVGSGARSPSEAMLKGHIDAGRIAHRTLVGLKPRAGLKSGCGQLACAVVVAEFTPESQLSFVEEQIEEGLDRGRRARGIRSDNDVLKAVSAALRVGAELLEKMVESAEPAAQNLLNEAELVEDKVKESFFKQFVRRS